MFGYPPKVIGAKEKDAVHDFLDDWPFEVLRGHVNFARPCAEPLHFGPNGISDAKVVLGRGKGRFFRKMQNVAMRFFNVYIQYD